MVHIIDKKDTKTNCKYASNNHDCHFPRKKKPPTYSDRHRQSEIVGNCRKLSKNVGKLSENVEKCVCDTGVQSKKHSLTALYLMMLAISSILQNLQKKSSTKSSYSK